MSTVYNLEPPTRGKVTLRTTKGDLDIELWAKEAPKAVRNFVQLCLEGYYDGTIFHRIIKDFMIQGGDPTGTGSGGESAYGANFKDEFHSRLRFSHRGIVACANQNEPNTNGSQFFITLDNCDWLDRKNTIFGKIVGDTIYNLLKLAEMEVDEEDRPVEPPRILSVDVSWNPFEDIVPRMTAEERAAEEQHKAAAAARAAKKGRKRNLALLSFGDAAEEEEAQLAALGAKAKIRSAHETLEDERLARPEDTPEVAALEAERAAELARVRAKLKKGGADAAGGSKRGGGGADSDGGRSKKRHHRGSSSSSSGSGDSSSSSSEEDSEDEERHNKGGKGGAAAGGAGASAAGGKKTMEQRVREAAAAAKQRDANRMKAEEERREQARREGGGGTSSSSDDDDEDEQRPTAKQQQGAGGTGREDVLYEFKQKTGGGRVQTEAVVADAELLKPYQLTREKYKAKKRQLGNRQQETLAKLAKFTAKLRGGGEGGSAAEPAPGAAAAAGANKQQSLAAGVQAAAAAATAAAAAAAAGEKGGGAAAAGVAGKAGEEQLYDGKVRQDIDHRAYMPAAWRVDDYLHAEEEEDDDLSSLRTHKLQFAAGAKDPNARRDDVDDYVVFDPLLEAAKGKFSRANQKAKKAATTQWAGRAVG